MARALKPQKVSEYKDRLTGMTVPIYLNRNTLKFFAEVGSEQIEDTTPDGVKKQLPALLAALATFEWHGCIKITNSPGEAGKAQVQLNYKRYWYAARPGGDYASLAWDDYARYQSDAERAAHSENFHYNSKAHGKFCPPCIEQGYYSGPHVYLPYDEMTWEGLESLSRRLKDANARLRDLLSDAHGWEQIKEAGKVSLFSAYTPAGQDKMQTQHIVRERLLQRLGKAREQSNASARRAALETFMDAHAQFNAYKAILKELSDYDALEEALNATWRLIKGPF